MAKNIEVSIKGRPWKVRFLSNSQYNKKDYGEDSCALTSCSTREIIFNISKITMGTIRHELLHAFVNECNIESSGLDAIQKEELCCSIIDEHGTDITHTTENIVDAAFKSRNKKGE